MYLDKNEGLNIIKKSILDNLIILTGASVVNSMRQSDFTIINSYEENLYIPPKVDVLKLIFLVDALISLKEPDYKLFKYIPEILKKKKKKF